jgi:hypothetical protein
MTDITKEELEEIKNLRIKLTNTVTESGQVNLQIELLQEDIVELKKKGEQHLKTFKSLLEEEQQLVNRLSKKYGTGSINFETGEFTSER